MKESNFPLQMLAQTQLLMAFLGESHCPEVRECNLGSENGPSRMLGFVCFCCFFVFQSNCWHLNFENISVDWLVIETPFCPQSSPLSLISK